MRNPRDSRSCILGGMIDKGPSQRRAQTADSTRWRPASRRSECLRHFSTSPSFRSWLGRPPDGVKRVLVDDVIYAHGGLAMVDVADRDEAVVERGEPVFVADNNVSLLHLKHVIGEVSRRRRE